ADRVIRLLDRNELVARLGGSLGAGVRAVAYESVNTITNTGSTAWTKSTGLLSILILGMFHPSPRTTVVLPFRKGPLPELGPVVSSDYFPRVPRGTLKVADAAVFFRGDGNHRCKIGIARPRARPVMGSYAPEKGVLTLVEYTLPSEAKDYVNSLWERQTHPYEGDVVNSYNDGPPETGA